MTTKKELQAQAEEKRLQELKEYKESLPLQILRLMAEAEEENITFKVSSTDYKSKIYKIEFFNPDDDEASEYIYTNSTSKWDLDNITKFIDNIKETRLEKIKKEELLKQTIVKVKAVLTEEELSILQNNINNMSWRM